MATDDSIQAGSAALGDGAAEPNDSPNVPLPAPSQPMQQGNVPGREALAASSPVLPVAPPTSPLPRWQDKRAAKVSGSFAQRLARAADAIGVPASPGGWARSLVGAAQVALSGMADASGIAKPEEGGRFAGMAQAAQNTRLRLQEQQRQQQKAEIEQRKQQTDEDRAAAENYMTRIKAFESEVGARKAGLEFQQKLTDMNKQYLAKLQDPEHSPDPYTLYRDDVPQAEYNQMLKSGQIPPDKFTALATEPIPTQDGRTEYHYTILKNPGPQKLDAEDIQWLEGVPEAEQFIKSFVGKDGKVDEAALKAAQPIPGEVYNRLRIAANTQKLAELGRTKAVGDMEFLKEKVNFDNDPFLQQAYRLSGFDPFTMMMNINQAMEHEKEMDAKRRGVPPEQGVSPLQQKYPQLGRVVASQFEEAGKPGSGQEALAKLANQRWAQQLDLWIPKSEMEASDAVVYFDKIAADNPKDAAAQANAKTAHAKLDTFEQAQTKVRVEEATKTAIIDAVGKGTGYEAMLKTGADPMTKENLSLANAPDSILLGHNGEPVPIDRNKELEPTQMERQTADRARQVLNISKGLRQRVTGNPQIAQVASTIYNNVREQLGNEFGKDADTKNYNDLSDKAKAKVGPMVGRWEQMLSKAGLGDRDAQSLLNDIIFLQSAATAMHTQRFSAEILKKMNSLITPAMNPDQFVGALDSIDKIATFYSKEDQVVTVGDWKRAEEQIGHTVMMQAPNGMVRMVSPGDVAHYQAKGAKLVANPGKPQMGIEDVLSGLPSSSVSVTGPAAVMKR